MSIKAESELDFDFQYWGRQVLDIELAAVQELYQTIDVDFNRACETIHSCRGKIVVMGVGKSGHIGRKIAATFASTGTPAFFVHPSEASHGDLGMLSGGDLLLAISNSGETQEIIVLMSALKRIGVPLIVITGRPESTLAQAADIHLCIGVLHEACPLGLAPTSSTTATLILGDALAVALLRARGFTKADFALSHPGGILGRQLLLRVADLMHNGAGLPMVKLGTSLRDTLLEMTRRGLGMTAVCDESGAIKGIFTDGDLRRALESGFDLEGTVIDLVMTRGGHRTTPDELAVEALNVMERRNITTLLVTEGDLLLGVIHLHDLLKSGIV